MAGFFVGVNQIISIAKRKTLRKTPQEVKAALSGDFVGDLFKGEQLAETARHSRLFAASAAVQK